MKHYIPSQAEAERSAMFLQGYWTALILAGKPLPERFSIHVQLAQNILEGVTPASNYPNLVRDMIATVADLEGEAAEKSEGTKRTPRPARRQRRIVTNLGDN